MECLQDKGLHRDLQDFCPLLHPKSSLIDSTILFVISVDQAAWPVPDRLVGVSCLYD